MKDIFRPPLKVCRPLPWLLVPRSAVKMGDMAEPRT